MLVVHPTPWNFLLSNLVGFPLTRIFSSKMLLYYTFMQKIIMFSAIKKEKIFLCSQNAIINLLARKNRSFGNRLPNSLASWKNIVVLGTNDTIHKNSFNQYEMAAGPRVTWLVQQEPACRSKESFLLLSLLQSVTWLSFRQVVALGCRVFFDCFIRW